jgi:hypothetical protein
LFNAKKAAMPAIASSAASECDYVREQHVHEAITRAVARVLDERPANAALRIGQLLVEAVDPSADPAEAAWEPFRKLSDERTASRHHMGGVKFFDSFACGPPDEFLHGQRSVELRRSMSEEFRDNDGGRWWAEYEYVAHRAAEEKELPSGGMRDQSRAGLTLADFCALPQAVEANLSAAEVAALRLYTGPLGATVDRALCALETDQWATTIACASSAVHNMAYRSLQATRRDATRRDAMRCDAMRCDAMRRCSSSASIRRRCASTMSGPYAMLCYAMLAVRVLIMLC